MEKEGLGFEITELRLGLPGGDMIGKGEKKRLFSDTSNSDDGRKSRSKDRHSTKSEVVGWPPVCSYRKKKGARIKEDIKGGEAAASKIMYVKVSMDGAPFLRKIDLSSLKDYQDLIVSFEKLFHHSGCGGLLKNGEGCEYISIYEDKDGDWMLVGDVPWKMFVESCKRLRIMKKSDAGRFTLKSENLVP